MALTDTQWAAAAADIFARLAASEITEAEAATELAAATANWPTRTMSNAGLAEQLSRFKARVNGLLLVDGPPDDDLGGVNAVAVDLTARVFYGPKVVSDEWPAGVPFAEGPPGPAIELRVTSTQVQWRVVGAASWVNLIPVIDLAGADGEEVQLRSNATHIQWRLGEGTWANLIALSDLIGADGREVQMGVSATHVQWRYAGEADWTNLLALVDVTPEAVPGPAAWTPVEAVVVDGERRVRQIVDWFGGDGVKPDTGMFIGPDGWVETAAEATDQRGVGGSNGTGSGTVVGPVLATNGAIALYDGVSGELLKDGPSPSSFRAAGAIPQSDVTNLTTDLAAKLASSMLDTDVTLAADSDAKIASQKAVKAFVAAALAALVDSSPTTLDTLNELAAALGDDPNFATTVATALGNKQPLDSDLTAIAALTTTTFGRSLLTLASAADIKPLECFAIALSDEATAITTGTAKVTWRAPYGFTITAVRASLATASSSGIPTVDINEGGSSILSTKLTIDAGEKTSVTAATAVVISDPNLADDAELTFDIDVAGTGAKGLKVSIYGYRA